MKEDRGKFFFFNLEQEKKNSHRPFLFPALPPLLYSYSYPYSYSYSYSSFHSCVVLHLAATQALQHAAGNPRNFAEWHFGLIVALLSFGLAQARNLAHMSTLLAAGTAAQLFAVSVVMAMLVAMPDNAPATKLFESHGWVRTSVAVLDVFFAYGGKRILPPPTYTCSSFFDWVKKAQISLSKIIWLEKKTLFQPKIYRQASSPSRRSSSPCAAPPSSPAPRGRPRP